MFVACPCRSVLYLYISEVAIQVCWFCFFRSFISMIIMHFHQLHHGSSTLAILVCSYTSSASLAVTERVMLLAMCFIGSVPSSPNACNIKNILWNMRRKRQSTFIVWEIGLRFIFYWAKKNFNFRHFITDALV